MLSRTASQSEVSPSDEELFSKSRLDLIEKHQLSPLMRHHYMVGDRWKDVVCGHTAGTQTVFVGDKYVYGDYPYHMIGPDYHASNIYDACQLIMERTV